MSEPYDEKIIVKAFLLFLGVSLIIMGFFALTLSQVATQTTRPSQGGSFIVIVGPFILAMGRNISPLLTAILVIISIAFILILVYLSKKFIGGIQWG